MHLRHRSIRDRHQPSTTLNTRSTRSNVVVRSTIATLVGLSLTMSAIAEPAAPLVKPASQEHHVGKVVFAELVTPDLVATERFYGQLFGWKFLDSKGTKYTHADVFFNNRPIAALVQKPLPTGEQRQSAWLSFLAVSDVDAAKKEAVEHGAKVLHEPHNIPDRGREAVFADPQGAVFAVLASSSGDPEDVLATQGEWIWSSLTTTNPDTSAAFYQSLFDYEVFELPPGEHSQHVLLASGNFARASVNSLPASNASGHPHWLNFVRVDDTVSTAAKVVSLGGRILVEPRVDRHGGKIAVVTDPNGAPFGLMEWTADDSKEVTK